MMGIQKKGMHIYERSEFGWCKVYRGLIEKQQQKIQLKQFKTGSLS